MIKVWADAEADFVIIGGLALQIHGGDYITQDVNPEAADWGAGSGLA